MIKVKKIVKKIPGTIILYTFLRKVISFALYFGNKYTCPVCKKSFRKFLPACVSEATVIYEKNVIGGGQRENSLCPYCNSTERLRLEYLYLQKHTNIFDTKNKVLHFAPEHGFEWLFRKSKNIDYLSGDIEKGCAMYVVDITEICFDDNEFDFVICNHVLEHVFDDKKAFEEIQRVLRPGGLVVITVPISLNSATTIETPTTSDKERLELYGQKDHFRLYGMDFSARLMSAGFDVTTYNAKDNISTELINKYLLLEMETIFIGKKGRSS